LLRDDMCDGLVGRLKESCRHVDKRPDVTVQLLLPNEWTPFDGAFNIGMTAGVETDRLNPLWVDAVNKMNLVVVPSAHVRKSFERSGDVTCPLHVIPESYIDTLDERCEEVDFGITSKFNFLIVGQFTSDRAHLDRKNLLNTIRI